MTERETTARGRPSDQIYLKQWHQGCGFLGFVLPLLLTKRLLRYVGHVPSFLWDHKPLQKKAVRNGETHPNVSFNLSNNGHLPARVGEICVDRNVVHA